MNNKREAREIMKSSGWLVKLSCVENSSFQRFSPTISRTHIEWASCVKVERDKLFMKKMTSYLTPNEEDRKSSASSHNDVKILSVDYLLKTYRAENKAHQNIVEVIVHKFSLNEEQERAFCIIANHASSLSPEPLKMYLGGMGRTGKSQVIKTIINLFDKRRESHRFIVLAPTGTATVLLNGSTYLGHKIRGR